MKTKEDMKKDELRKLLKRSKEGITECIRCCTCCAKGGPALHLEDKPLIDSGALHGRFLYTIRKNEPVEDNVQGKMTFAESDIIRIKSKVGSDTCLYADLNNASCSIYEQRPAECRILKCWDTKELEDYYRKDRLTRKDILGHVEGLWETIEEHEKKCSWEEILNIVSKNRNKLGEDAQETLFEMIQYDKAIRDLVVAKANVEPNLLDFLFGLPLEKKLRQMGIEFAAKQTGQ